MGRRDGTERMVETKVIKMTKTQMKQELKYLDIEITNVTKELNQTRTYLRSLKREKRRYEKQLIQMKGN